MQEPYPRSTGSIKTWQDTERPRERLFSQGVAKLTLVELIGILLHAGHAEASALALAREMLRAVDYDLHRLARWQPSDFTHFKGVGPAKAARIVAAMELGRRREQQKFNPLTPILDSEQSYQYLKTLIEDLEHEEFWLLCLNQGNRLLATHRISQGGITGTVADNRLIFRHAINTTGCVALILAHNHPSGQLRPSKADIQLTKKICWAAQQFDLTVLDHLIIGQGGYFSFQDEKLL